MSDKVWFVWRWRLIAAGMLIYPVADSFCSKTNFLPLLFETEGILLALIFCTYKNLRIDIKENTLAVTKGFIICKTIHIPAKHICAARFFETPLCRQVGLCNLIIYCQGARFVLPLTTKDTAEKLTNLTRKKSK